MNREKIKEILDETKIKATEELDILLYIDDLEERIARTNQFVEKNKMILKECYNTMKKQNTLGEASQSIIEERIKEYETILRMLKENNDGII